MRVASLRLRRRARIEIIPLIDIIFFLLATFVMVSLSMIKNQGIPVNLPASSTAVPQDRKAYSVITVTEKGTIFFDKEPVTRTGLIQHLKLLKASFSEPRIFINGDKKTTLGILVRILDDVRKQGITKVALQTTAEEKGAGR